MQKVYHDTTSNHWEFYFNENASLDAIIEYLNDLLFEDSDFQSKFNDSYTCYAHITSGENILITGDDDYVFVNVTKIQPIF